MGQIPVKVRGKVNIGDYILPSGYNDGTGIGVAPKDITSDQYASIVGVAWSETLEGSRRSLVNMAIGLNTNDVANLVNAQEERLTSLEERLMALESGVSIQKSAQVIAEVEEPNPVNLDEWLPTEISSEYWDQGVDILVQRFEAMGIPLESHPGLYKIVNDPAFKAEVISKSHQNYIKIRKHIVNNPHLFVR